MAAGIFKLVNSCFLIFTIGYVTPTPPKSVNLAVETSFLFEPDDIRQNTTMLSNVRQFLDKLEDLLTPDEPRKPNLRSVHDTVTEKSHERKNENEKALTMFLTEMGGLVINYDDEEVRSLAVALNDAVSKNYVTNPKFHEIFKNTALKTFIKDTTHEWTTWNPIKLKVEIARYITSYEGSAFITFFQSLNTLFKDDKAKLKKLAKKFSKARKTKQFAKPMEKAFNLMFNRYEKMDDNSKSLFHKELDKLTEHVANLKLRTIKTKEPYRRSDKIYDFSKSVKPSRRSGNADVSESVKPSRRSGKVEELSESVRDDLRNSDNSIENVQENASQLRLENDLQVSVHADDVNRHLLS